MLAQCRTHGFYRGELCPLCDERGRFVMKDHEIDRVGRMMAGILRHFPERFNLTMDGRGWVDLDAFVEAIRNSRPNMARWLHREHIEALVETDEKGRYQIDGGMIRATYAHSIPVNLDDLPEANVDKLYFPVVEEELDLVLENGLRPSDRNMIHLSASPDKAYSAGRVHISDPILLEVDVKAATGAGNFIFRAGKSVYVTESVDAKFLSKFTDEETMAKLREEFGTSASDAEKKAADEAADAARRAEGGDGGADGGKDAEGPAEGKAKAGDEDD
ncbi:MAG TPA: RNA 2'-phosphotransferase [Candidatus Thermoplasmatota archaeon]|nr:RNA 2'-phosphotransferase [Candidatus Thermoplasmatota archaeon]